MKRRYRFLLVLVAIAIGAVVWWTATPREAAYQGKPLSRWIAEIKAGDPDHPADPGRSWAQREAIQALGLEALPALLESLRPLKEPWWPATYRWCYQRVPSGLRQHLPQPAWEVEREMTFRNDVIADCHRLRPQSEPLLLRTLDHSRPEVRSAAAMALDGRSNASPEMFSALTNHLWDPDAETRANVLNAIGCFGPAASNAVPAITAILLRTGCPRDFRPLEIDFSSATMALGQIGPGAIAAVPTLQAGTAQRTNAVFRLTSALALWHIRHQAADVFPVLLQEFGAATPSTPSTKWLIMGCWGEMGPEAAAAAPSLVALLDSAVSKRDHLDAFNRRVALETLEKIAPEVAAKRASKITPPQP